MTLNNRYYLLVSILIVRTVFTEEIITFQRRNNVTCVFDDVTVPIFISPPSPDENFEGENDNLLTEGTWAEDDWFLHVADNLTPGTTTDRRWQDLPTLYTDYLSFENRTSVSFSVYGPIEFTLFMTGEGINRKYNVKIQHGNGWTHCSIVAQNKMVVYQQDGHNLKKWRHFKPDTFIIKSAVTTYWKDHSYQFKLAQRVTTSKPTTLTIPASRKTCVLLYTLLCRTCSLEVLLLNSISSKIRLINLTSSEIDVTNFWETHVLEIQQDIDTQIQFYRNGSQPDGLWAIDVRMCPNTYNTWYVYTKTLSTPEAKECSILKNNGKIQNKREKSDNIDSINKNKSTCKPGFVGLYCDVSCATILGRRFTFCEQHRICQASKCTCSWGYEGELCQDRCGSGMWGLFCQKECTCNECNNISGACVTQPRAHTKGTFEHYLENPIIAFILVVSVITAFIMKFYVFKVITAPLVDSMVGLWQRWREDIEKPEELLLV